MPSSAWPRRPRTFIAAALAATIALAAQAQATWSIILIDTRTGEIALGSATCLTGFDLRAATPILIPLVGGATAQSFVDNTGQNRVFIRDELMRGTDPEQILDLLSAFDNGHQTRQYGIADTLGRPATFSGTRAGPWAGGQTGQFGDIIYAIQGNVLTGEPVVLNAVQAAINTPGDLAEKMMAAMEAARAMGGDGRCSCSRGDPTGCGSPPPDFEKSAHIAYMLIARAGDQYGGNGINRVGTTAAAVLNHDLNNDSRPDIISADFSSDTISVLLNETTPLTPFPIFERAVSYPAGDGAVDLAMADFNRDGVQDIITADNLGDSVSVMLGSPDATFELPARYSIGDQPRAVVAIDLNGDAAPDAVAANAGASTISILINRGTGTFNAARTMSVGASPYGLAAADFNDDGAPDLAIAIRDEDKVILLMNDGQANFSQGQVFDVPARPVAIVANDLNDDGDIDIVAACQSGGAVVVLINDGGNFSPAHYTIASPTALTSEDVDNDGLMDLITTGFTSGRVNLLIGQADGTFADGGSFRPSNSLRDASLADFDADADLDLSLAAGGRGVIVVENLGDGSFNDGDGVATGDYFMNFNVAFQAAGDPDPVFQLHDMFVPWRDDLVGRPDAVMTIANVDPAAIPADGHTQAVLTFELRDWQDEPVTATIQSVTVEHALDSAGRSAIGDVVDHGDGSYSVVLTAGDMPGMDKLWITIDDGIRPVVLMPLPMLSQPDPDFNGDGLANIIDLLAMLNAFSSGDPSADINRDGIIDSRDVLLFLLVYDGR